MYSLFVFSDRVSFKARSVAPSDVKSVKNRYLKVYIQLQGTWMYEQVVQES